jgi:prepilin-type N-terminal cleavage/methylation domain-containing protein
MKLNPRLLFSTAERGSVSRSTVGDQDAALNSAALGLRTRSGSQTRAPGFSLVEVIVAVAILSIALVGLAHGISTALGSSKEAEWQTTAAMYAAGLIENLRAEGGILDGETQGDCGEELPLYRWTKTITAAGVDGLHQVDVSILNTRTGREIYALRTLLFEMPADSDSKNKDPKSKKKSRGAS